MQVEELSVSRDEINTVMDTLTLVHKLGVCDVCHQPYGGRPNLTSIRYERTLHHSLPEQWQWPEGSAARMFRAAVYCPHCNVERMLIMTMRVPPAQG